MYGMGLVIIFDMVRNDEGLVEMNWAEVKY